MIDSYAYETAIELRAKAEESNDPSVYELAAKYFEIADMKFAAVRCQERAQYYRQYFFSNQDEEKEE